MKLKIDYTLIEDKEQLNYLRDKDGHQTWNIGSIAIHQTSFINMITILVR